MIYSCIFQWNGLILYLTADEEYLLSIGFNEPEEVIWKENEVLLKIKRQLQKYFAGTLKEFEIPIRLRGTDFQQLVWKKLLDIPYGKVMSYGEIAVAIGKPGAARAVGMACNRNPLAIVVPCHRVIGKNRKLIGYAGGIDVKRMLIELESMA